MKTLNSLLAVTAMIGTAAVQAAVYHAYGSQDFVSTSSTMPAIMSSSPFKPSFTSYWDFSTTAFNAVEIYFQPHRTHLSIAGGQMVADLEYRNASYSIVGGTFSYDAATLTLRLTNATAIYTGLNPTCSGNELLLCSDYPDPHMEDVDLTLRFVDVSLELFSGQIFATNIGNGFFTSNYVHAWTVANFTEIPAPAAAWLFGSGLMSLVRVFHRRRIAA